MTQSNHHHHHHRRFCVHLQRWPADNTMLKVLGSVKNFSEQKRFQMSSEGCRCRLATNVIWKAVPGSRTCIREGPLVEPGKCTRHNIVHSGRWSKTTASSCCRNSLYSRTSGGCYYQHGCVSWTQTTSSVDVRCPEKAPSKIRHSLPPSHTLETLNIINLIYYQLLLYPAVLVELQRAIEFSSQLLVINVSVQVSDIVDCDDLHTVHTCHTHSCMLSISSQIHYERYDTIVCI